jgi:hypothetical protein
MREVEALDRGTTDELLAKRKKALDSEVELEFKKREQKHHEKDKEK